jgi:hypothetical protein
MNRLQNLIIFKHIAKGRSANNTFAKSLKSTLFSFANVTQKKEDNERNRGFATSSFFVSIC